MRTPILALLALTTLALSGCDDFFVQAQDMDSDGNSKLSSEEISAGLVRLTDTQRQDGVVSEAELREAFEQIGLLKAWDKDGNGKVNATDFVFLFPQSVGDPDNRFSNWDTNGDGTLVNAELAASLFNKFDLDRNNSLDRGEMEEVFVFYGGINAYDTDNDGELSFLELEKIPLRL